MIGGEKQVLLSPENLSSNLGHPIHSQNCLGSDSAQKTDDCRRDHLNLTPKMGLNTGSIFLFPGNAVLRRSALDHARDEKGIPLETSISQEITYSLYIISGALFLIILYRVFQRTMRK